MLSDRYTLVYRAIEDCEVMDWLKTEQSGCLIGLREVVTSNFLAFLRRGDVRQHYLGQDYADFTFILIDLLALAEQTEVPVYQLLFGRLRYQLDSTTVDSTIVAKTKHLHRESPIQCLIEHSLNIFCRWPSQQLVFLFEKCNPIFKNLPSLFYYVQSLRDNHREECYYIVTVTNDLASL